VKSFKNDKLKSIPSAKAYSSFEGTPLKISLPLFGSY
jgi:hypothetical protein